MKLNRLLAPLLTLVALWIALGMCVWATFDRLPERVATHFGGSGKPDGWMTRTGHVQFLLGFAIGLRVFLHGVFALIRASGGVGCNIPNREYWPAPGRRDETLDYVQRQGAWFVCLMVGFFAGMHLVVLNANLRQPPLLSASLLTLVTSGFLVLLGLWAARLLFRFARLPTSRP